MIRLPQRRTGQYRFTVSTVDDAGEPLVVTAPLTATVYDGAGVAGTPVTPTYDAQAHTLEAVVDVTAMPLLDTYRVVFTGTVDGGEYDWPLDVELVGGFLFSLTELRARDTAFANADKYPNDLLAWARVKVEQTIEGPDAARVAFVPRGRRTTLSGTGRPGIRVPDFEVREVFAASVGGVALTPEQLDAIVIDDGVLWLPSGVWTAGRRNVALHYAHGRDFPVGPINRAGLTLAREYLVDPNISTQRATATTVGDQTFRLTIAGRDGVTGLPEVDAAIEQHGRARLMMG